MMINRRELNLSDPESEALKTKATNTRAELCQMLAEGQIPEGAGRNNRGSSDKNVALPRE